MARQVHRYLCDVLEEMRTANKSRNYSYFKALIEEVQILGNRMEAALDEKKDCEFYHDKGKELQMANEKLTAKKEKLTKQIQSLKKQLKQLKKEINTGA